MYVHMYASNFLLFRSTLPDPQGDRTGTNEPHYRSGEGGSEAFTVWINVRFPLNICTGEVPAYGMRSRDIKIHANFPTFRHQNHKDPTEVHDHDRKNHWKGYQSIQ